MASFAGVGARWSGWSGAAAVTLAALITTLNVGSRVGVSGSRPAVPDATHLDYSLDGRGRFQPLRPSFIQSVLGLGSGIGPAPITSISPQALGLVRQPPPFPGPRAPDPAVIEHPFTNRDFANAYEVPKVPFAARTDTTSESRQLGEPTSCSAVGGTAWYRFVPPTSVTLQADTAGTTYATALGVFQGGSLATLHQVGCATSATGNSTVGFIAFAGQPYYFQISGPVGGGELHFTLAAHPETVLISTLLRGYDPKRAPNDPYTLTGGAPTVDFRGGAMSGTPSPSRQCEISGRGACGQVWYADFPFLSFTQVSVSSAGVSANGPSHSVALSGDGRLVAFDSTADNLVAGDTNGMPDVFVHDRLTGRTTRESVSASGGQLAPRPGDPSADPFRGSTRPVLSADGRFLAYASNAADRGPGDACRTHFGPGAAYHLCLQTMLRDRLTGTTTLVSAAPSGTVGNGDSGVIAMSPDGRYLLIFSNATDLTSGPVTSCDPIKTCLAVLLWDRLTRRFDVVSVSSRGVPADGQVGTYAAVSADGRLVSFASDGGNLAPGAGLGTVQTYVRDRRMGTTEAVSVTSDGQTLPDPEASVVDNGATPIPQFITASGADRASSLSADGRYVSFNSAAKLTPDAPGGMSQVFVRDRLSRRTTMVSVAPDGQPGNGASTVSLLSPDGGLVDFASQASNLVNGDDNQQWDFFYRGWHQP